MVISDKGLDNFFREAKKGATLSQNVKMPISLISASS
jgi:hypothetical protein